MTVFNHPIPARAAALLPRPSLGMVFRLALAAYAAASAIVLISMP